MKRILKFNSYEDLEFVNQNKRPIGTGAFSEVCLVYHKKDPSQIFAMKKLHKKDKTEEYYIQKEINLHQNLDHENIIKLYDSFENETHSFLILEYAEKGDLFEYLKKNKLNKFQLLQFFYQTTLAIDYLHQKNILHRDLKPENLLLDKDLNVKICDFGWSVEFEEGKKRQTLCGTYEYMAPEVYYGEQQTTKADVWGLGILLYELFQGKPPFRARKINDFFQSVKNGQLVFNIQIDEDIKNLINSILIYDPQKRISTKQILDNHLFDKLKKNKLYEVPIPKSDLNKILYKTMSEDQQIQQHFKQKISSQNDQKNKNMEHIKSVDVFNQKNSYRNFEYQKNSLNFVEVENYQIANEKQNQNCKDFYQKKKIKYSFQQSNLTVNILERAQSTNQKFKQQKPQSQNVNNKMQNSGKKYFNNFLNTRVDSYYKQSSNQEYQSYSTDKKSFLYQKQNSYSKETSRILENYNQRQILQKENKINIYQKTLGDFGFKNNMKLSSTNQIQNQIQNPLRSKFYNFEQKEQDNQKVQEEYLQISNKKNSSITQINANKQPRSLSKTTLRIKLDKVTDKKYYKKLSQGNYKFLQKKFDESLNKKCLNKLNSNFYNIKNNIYKKRKKNSLKKQENSLNKKSIINKENQLFQNIFKNKNSSKIFSKKNLEKILNKAKKKNKQLAAQENINDNKIKIQNIFN